MEEDQLRLIPLLSALLTASCRCGGPDPLPDAGPDLVQDAGLPEDEPVPASRLLLEAPGGAVSIADAGLYRLELMELSRVEVAGTTVSAGSVPAMCPVPPEGMKASLSYGPGFSSTVIVRQASYGPDSASMEFELDGGTVLSKLQKPRLEMGPCEP